MSTAETRTAPATCTNPAHRYLHIAPVPCPDCRGWLDHDGTVMDRATTISRYPFMAQQINGSRRELLPDYTGPTRGEQAMRGVELTGAIARGLLAIIFAGLLFALIVVILLALLGVL